MSLDNVCVLALFFFVLGIETCLLAALMIVLVLGTRNKVFATCKRRVILLYCMYFAT